MDDSTKGFLTGAIGVFFIFLLVLLPNLDNIDASTICTAAGYTTVWRIEGEFYCARTENEAKIISLDDVIERIKACNE